MPEGPRLRTDVVDAYVFRRGDDVQFLQLLRKQDPLGNTWQPIMGHIEQGETAVDCMFREVQEEAGLSRGSSAMLGAWALEGVHPFYLHRRDAIVLSPRFGVEVDPAWSPTLNEEHSDHRWIEVGEVESAFMWPGQRAALAELLEQVIRPPHRLAEALRLHP